MSRQAYIEDGFALKDDTGKILYTSTSFKEVRNRLEESFEVGKTYHIERQYVGKMRGNFSLSSAMPQTIAETGWRQNLVGRWALMDDGTTNHVLILGHDELGGTITAFMPEKNQLITGHARMFYPLARYKQVNILTPEST